MLGANTPFSLFTQNVKFLTTFILGLSSWWCVLDRLKSQYEYINQFVNTYVIIKKFIKKLIDARPTCYFTITKKKKGHLLCFGLEFRVIKQAVILT